jgi:hypothetical protein
MGRPEYPASEAGVPAAFRLIGGLEDEDRRAALLGSESGGETGVAGPDNDHIE